MKASTMVEDEIESSLAKCQHICSLASHENNEGEKVADLFVANLYNVSKSNDSILFPFLCHF